MANETKATARGVSAPEQKVKDRILVVEDEDNARRGYELMLKGWGYEVLGCPSAEEVLARYNEFRPAALLADIGLPGMNGLELLGKLGDELKSVPAIIITGDGSEEREVESVQAGAFWFIKKPLKATVLRALLDRALSRVRDLRHIAALTKQLREAGRLGELVGGSKPMQEVMRMAELAAPSSASVLITGETGSGKEILARTIHKLSPRVERPFVALLRVLEDHKVRRLGSKSETPVDVRVLAATNKDPEQAVAKGFMRQDLYFRLNVFHIHLPPLREHKEDLVLLVEHMLRDINAKHAKQVRNVGAEVMDVFMSYTWPGNVRELRNVLERAAIVCDRDLIGRAHLPADFGRTQAGAASGLSAIRFPIGTTVDAAERELIMQTLSATSNNKTRAAELLGISLKTLHNKLKEYGGDRAEAE